MMDSQMMERWLMDMQKDGWEFISYGQTNWHERTPQEWWIFRRVEESDERPTD
jgi:hypothetical protein